MSGDSEQASAEWCGFSAAFERGRREVLILRLLRSERLGSRTSRRRPRTWIPWLALSYWPLACAAVATMLPAGWSIAFSSGNWLVLVTLGSLNAGCFAAASLAWDFATRRARTVDALIATSDVRDDAVSPISTGLKIHYQAVLPTCLGIVPVIVMIRRVVAVGGQSGSQWILAGAAVWTLVLVANDVWWLLVPPLIVWRLCGGDRLDLRWHDPARTPGIRTLAEGYGYAASFLVLAAFCVTVPNLTGNFLLGSWVPTVWTVLIALSCWTGIGSQIAIFYLVRRERLRSLDELAVGRSWKSPVLLLPLKDADESVADSIAVYQAVSSSASLPYGSATVVQYFAALVGSVVGFVLQARG